MSNEYTHPPFQELAVLLDVLADTALKLSEWQSDQIFEVASQDACLQQVISVAGDVASTIRVGGLLLEQRIDAAEAHSCTSVKHNDVSEMNASDIQRVASGTNSRPSHAVDEVRLGRNFIRVGDTVKVKPSRPRRHDSFDGVVQKIEVYDDGTVKQYTVFGAIGNKVSMTRTVLPSRIQRRAQSKIEKKQAD